MRPTRRLFNLCTKRGLRRLHEIWLRERRCGLIWRAAEENIADEMAQLRSENQELKAGFVQIPLSQVPRRGRCGESDRRPGVGKCYTPLAFSPAHPGNPPNEVKTIMASLIFKGNPHTWHTWHGLYARDFDSHQMGLGPVSRRCVYLHLAT
jgi:hypothetical protein